MIKKYRSIIFIVMIFSFLYVYPESIKLIKNKNDFGGKTYEVNYTTGDKFYDQLQINRAILHYDKNEELAIVEYYFTKEFVAKKNYEKKIEYYGDKKKVNKAEYFYTKKFADEKGTYKVVDILDSNGEVVEVLFFHTDKFTSKYGFETSIMYLARGYITKIEYYYKDDFVKKYGYKIREDKYVYDSYGNKKPTLAIFYDEGGKEVNRIENPTNYIEPER